MTNDTDPTSQDNLDQTEEEGECIGEQVDSTWYGCFPDCDPGCMLDRR